MERTMDAIAAYLGKDRVAVREVNLITPDEMPYDHQLLFQDGKPLVYDSGDYPVMMAKIKELVGWDDFEAVREQARAEGRRVGIGLAAYVEGTGPGPYEGAHVVVETSGKVKVATGLTTQGQGHQTSFAQIVADQLGVDVADVEVVTGDTRRFRYAVGTFASRAAVMAGSAMHVAAGKVRDKALRIAADALEVDVADLELVDGVARVKGTPAGGPGTEVPLATLAVLSNPLRYAFDTASQAATAVQRRRPLAAAGARGRGAGPGGHRLLLAEPEHVRLRHPRRRDRDRPAHRRGADPALLRGARLRHAW